MRKILIGYMCVILSTSSAWASAFGAYSGPTTAERQLGMQIVAYQNTAFQTRATNDAAATAAKAQTVASVLATQLANAESAAALTKAVNALGAISGQTSGTVNLGAGTTLAYVVDGSTIHLTIHGSDGSVSEVDVPNPNS